MADVDYDKKDQFQKIQNLVLNGEALYARIVQKLNLEVWSGVKGPARSASKRSITDSDQKRPAKSAN